MTDRDRRAADRVWDRYREMVRLLHEAGVAILAGTDQAPDGASLHRELELLVEAGLSPAEAIVAATSRPTAFLGLIVEVGTVEVGKQADLVLLDGDPLADITNTRRIAAVVIGGSLLDRDDLRRLVAGQPVATPFRIGLGAPGQSAPQPRQHRELVEPSAWPAELTRRWTVPVGQGYATPIIVGDRVFMFTRQIVAGRARRPPPRAFRGAMSGMSENHASGFPPPASDQDHRPQHTQPDVHQLWLRWRLSTPPSMNSAGHRSRHDVARAASRIQLACWRRLMCSRAAIARNPERVVPASLAASSMRSSVRRAIEMFSRTVSRSASRSARSTLTAPII